MTSQDVASDVACERVMGLSRRDAVIAVALRRGLAIETILFLLRVDEQRERDGAR